MMKFAYGFCFGVCTLGLVMWHGGCLSPETFLSAAQAAMTLNTFITVLSWIGALLVGIVAFVFVSPFLHALRHVLVPLAGATSVFLVFLAEFVPLPREAVLIGAITLAYFTVRTGVSLYRYNDYWASHRCALYFAYWAIAFLGAVATIIHESHLIGAGTILGMIYLLSRLLLAFRAETTYREEEIRAIAKAALVVVGVYLAQRTIFADVSITALSSAALWTGAIVALGGYLVAATKWNARGRNYLFEQWKTMAVYGVLGGAAYALGFQTLVGLTIVFAVLYSSLKPFEIPDEGFLSWFFAALVSGSMMWAASWLLTQYSRELSPFFVAAL